MAYNSANERIRKVNGVELATETFGNPKDKPILLIQGAGNSMISWGEGFCQTLADGGRFILRYDNRDVGRSTSFEVGKPSYGLYDLLDDAVGLLDTYGIQKAHVVGLSQGAAIAQLLAINHSERLLTATLISGTPGGPGHHATDLPDMTEEIAKIFRGEGDSIEPNWRNRDFVVKYLVDGERPFAGRALFDEEWFFAVSGMVFERTINLAAQITNPFLLDPGDPWRGKLRTIVTPTLVIHGVHDPLFPLAHGEALTKEIPGANLVKIEDMGHAQITPALWLDLAAAILKHTK